MRRLRTALHHSKRGVGSEHWPACLVVVANAAGPADVQGGGGGPPPWPMVVANAMEMVGAPPPRRDAMYDRLRVAQARGSVSTASRCDVVEAGSRAGG